MPNRFEYTDPEGGRLRFEPITERGKRLVMVSATSPEHSLVVVDIALDRLEEVIAGLRDIARQAGAQTAPRGIRALLEHVGIDTTGKDITVAGEVVDAALDRQSVAAAGEAGA